MERFPDGTHVWLRNRVRGTYLYADEDGSGVSLSTRRATLNAAWQVHLVVRRGTAFILLRSAAYGRYLGPSTSPVAQPPDGRRGRTAVQRDNSEPTQVNIRWRARAVAEGVNGGDGGDVLLYHWPDEELCLRANDGWNIGVTVDANDGNESTMMHWTVEHIPLRPAPPPLPSPTPTVEDLGGCTGLFQQRTGTMTDQELERQIRYFVADNDGIFLVMGAFRFLGRSVSNLTNQMAIRANKDMSAITLCVYAGVFGKLTPLVVDLPHSQEPLNIIVFPISSLAATRLRHPNVDAPEPEPSSAPEGSTASGSASAPPPAS